MKAESELSEGVQGALVGMLFTQLTALCAGAVALSIAAVLCWLRTGQIWFLVWAALMLVVLAARAALECAFRARRDPAGSVHGWRVAFVVGAWSMGALWGLAGVTIFMRDEPLVQMLVISVETVIIMGAAARNASCPLAARGQTVLGLAPLFVAYLTMSDPYYRGLSVFIVFALLGALAIIRHLYDRNVRFLIMNEQNDALVREVQRANADLAAANVRLEYAALTDSLTAIANRRRFDAALAAEVLRSQRERSELALLLLDIDLFKSFNDKYGHQAGDQCLQRVAVALEATFRRPGDLVARYGGEEFAVILPQTDSPAAVALAETARRTVEELIIPSAGNSAGAVSVSIGVATFAASRYRRPEDFIRGADEALYSAKGAGRNCVRVMREDDREPLNGESGRRAFVAPEV